MTQPGANSRSRRLRDLVRRRREARRRRMRGIAAVPTMLTLGNLICGFAAIHYAMKPVETTRVFDWTTLYVAATLLFLGMFFDAIDGSVARLTRSTSDLGAQLDSLADVVSFGVAPAFMMLRLVSHYYYPPGQAAARPILGPEADSVFAKFLWAIAAVYVCCTALRLARFNAETTSAAEEDHRNFKGLPSPGAGGTIASLILLHQSLLSNGAQVSQSLTFDRAFALGLPFVTLICAFAMVSTVRYAHFVNRFLRAKRDFSSFVRLAIPVVVAVFFPHIALAVGFTLYALSGPAYALSLILRRRSVAPPSAPSPS